MLRIDLLPKTIVRGRRNIKVAAICLLLVALSALVMLVMLQQLKSNIVKAEDTLADAKQRADEVRKLQADASAKKADLAPIQEKVDFVEAADKSGEQFFERFWAISEYIYSGAQMTNFQITPPNSVSFTVRVSNTTDAGRFVLNLLRCPHLTGIQIGGMQGGDLVQPSTAPPAISVSVTDNIEFSVSGTLVDPVEIIQPPGGDSGGGPGGPMMGGPEDMMESEMYGPEVMPEPGPDDTPDAA